MNRLWKLLQYGYLIIAAVLVVDGILTVNSDGNKAVFRMVFAGFIVLLFFFKRHFRKKVQQRTK